MSGPHAEDDRPEPADREVIERHEKQIREWEAEKPASDDKR